MFLQKPKALPESGLTKGTRRRRRRSLERSRSELGAGQFDRSRGEEKKDWAGEEKALGQSNFIQPNVAVVDDDI